MKKSFITMFATFVAIALTGCSTPSNSDNSNTSNSSNDNGSAPVIREIFFIDSTLSDSFQYQTYNENDPKPARRSSIIVYNNNVIPDDPPYYLFIAFTDADKDINSFDETTIQDRNMKASNQMPSVDSYYIQPVRYSTTEIPNNNINNGQYTFKFQAKDLKGNVSAEYPVTINVTIQ